MTDEPRHKLRRRSPIQVEPLEDRVLLSAVKATTPPRQAQLVIGPSSRYVNQQQGSFTVILYLKKAYNPQVAATLDEPLTVYFSASIDPSGSATSEAASPVFAPFHESVTFPAGASAETVSVPIISSATATVPTEIFLSAGATPGSRVDLGVPGSVYLDSGPDASPPTITGVQLVSQGELASAIVLGFSKPMAQATVENIHNYRILSRPKQTSHKGFLFWGGSATMEIQSFPIAAANYDPSTSTVTLTLKRPARASSLYEVSSAYPLKGHELTDTEGQPVVSPSNYDFVMADGFTNLIHPIPGVTPSPVGLLKTTRRTDSPVSNLNPMKGFA
jgi:hypothetical protein